MPSNRYLLKKYFQRRPMNVENSLTHKLEQKAHQINPSSEGVREAFGNGGFSDIQGIVKKHAHQRFSSIYNQMKWWSGVVRKKINETYITPICGGKVDMMERWLGPTHITLNELISIQGWVFDQTLSLVIKLCVWWSFFFFSFLIFGLLRRTDDQTLSVTSLIYT